VPNFSSNTVTVVRGSSGAVLQTLTGNGLSGPTQAAFDGERILVTNHFGDSVSLWKAADLTVIGNFQTGGGSGPEGACSDGIRFWIGMEGSKIARF
jgi:DNA-binding beta-propeller fold protein YncE